MDERAKRCLDRYVHDFAKPQECVRALLPVILSQPKRAMTLYRGQDNEPKINRLGIRGFLSTSKNKTIAMTEFSKGGCCVFTIHVAGDVPSLDVYKFIPKGPKGEEDEVLLPEGGYFYQDASLKTEGFMPTKSGEFETWYSMKAPQAPQAPPPPPRTRTIAEWADMIDPDEYELIDGPEDIHFNETVSFGVKEAVFAEIERRKKTV
jgi:hypothetical protein